jgi:single-stranded-DNA-specific exonuclease
MSHTLLQGEKYLWKLPHADMQQLSEFAGAYNLSFPVMQALLSRGIKTREELDSYLLSSYEKDVAHPSLLKDANKAVDRLQQAIAAQEKILIAGDYDVDGITSSALLLTCLLPLGAKINFFLPHRVNDGYGLSVKTVQRAAQNGYKLIITVDNGITAFAAAVEAKRLGIDLIITDHHRPHDHVPEAFAIIDPHQADCSYPFKYFAGVGVGFKLMQLLYERLGLPLPKKVYELLLLGTVADVVPLRGENRFWVRHGLQQINAEETFCLKVLKENARFTKTTLSSTDIGFFITPQINALGRLEDARSGVKFLIGSDEQETVEIGKLLGDLNQARKSIESSIVDDIQKLIYTGTIDLATTKAIVAAHDSWPPGVIGLVASRIVAAHGRPTILLHLTPQGLAKGSCRSIPELNMFEALCSVKDLLHTFGGHPMAAGLSLDASNIPLFTERINAYIAERLTDADLVQKIGLDAELRLSETNSKLVSDMAYLEPFGCENPQPKFYIRNVSLIEPPMLLKDLHVKCLVFDEGVIKPVIFFNRPELYPKLLAQRSEPVSLAVTISENHWQGRVNVELMGIDVSFGK